MGNGIDYVMDVLPEKLMGWQIEDVMSESLSASVYLLQDRKDETKKGVLKVIFQKKENREILDILGNVNKAAECPNTVRILEAFREEDSGRGYILMPYYHTLYDYQQTNKLTQPEILKMTDELLQALDALHAKNLFHSDVKPENVLVDKDGTFLLGDLDSVQPMNRTVLDITREYVAPEMEKAEKICENTDLYSLALLAYRLLNHGRLPFLPADVQLLTPDMREQAIEKRLTGAKIPAPSEADPEVGKVLCKALAFAPEDRYENAGAFRRALSRAPERNQKKKSRRKIAALATVAAVCLLAAGGIYYKMQAPIARGNCGEDASYVLSKEGLLTISGTGICDTYEPLMEYADEVKEIVIEPGITEIGYCAFYMFGSLEKVTLPEGLEVIDGSAFFNCYNLEEVEFPSTLKRIDSMGFCMCQKLTEIELPEGFESLGDDAFDNCILVTEVKLPYTLTGIGIGAFNGDSSLESIDIPSGVTSIGEGAFSACTSLTQVNCDEKWLDPELYIFVGTPIEGENE